MIRVESGKVSRNSKSGTARVCQHYRVREIGQDVDKDGRALMLERCVACGLLMREYLVIS